MNAFLATFLKILFGSGIVIILSSFNGFKAFNFKFIFIDIYLNVYIRTLMKCLRSMEDKEIWWVTTLILQHHI